MDIKKQAVVGIGGIIAGLAIASSAVAYNRDTFKSAYEECVYKEMVYYHAGRNVFFVTVEEKDGWYFFGKNNKKYKFKVPPKVMRRIVYLCERKRT